MSRDVLFVGSCVRVSCRFSSKVSAFEVPKFSTSIDDEEVNGRFSRSRHDPQFV